MSYNLSENLSNTQKELLNYIDSNILINERVIFFSKEGSFGAEYAINTYCKKNKMDFIKYENAFDDDRKSYNTFYKFFLFFFMYIFPVLSVVMIIIWGLNVFVPTKHLIDGVKEKCKNKKSIDYYYGAKKSKKYTKVKKVIYLEEYEMVENKHINKLEEFIKSIRNRFYSNCVIIIATEYNHNQYSFLFNNSKKFCFTADDLSFFTKISFKNSKITKEDILIFGKLGVMFLRKYKSELIEFVNSKNDIFDIALFINQLYDKIDLDETSKKNITELLRLVSFYANSFKVNTLTNYENYEQSDIEVAIKINILTHYKDNYQFSKQIMKNYFYKSYILNHTPAINKIYSFFKIYEPFEYFALLKLGYIEPSIMSMQEFESLYVKAYYSALNFGTIYDKNSIRQNYNVSKSIIVVVETYESFVTGNYIEHETYSSLCENIRNSNIDHIAKLILISLSLQVLKERFGIKSEYEELLDEMLKEISNFENEAEKGMHNLYWSLFFKELFIAFSLESKKDYHKTAYIFINELEDKSRNTLLKKYIMDNKIRELNRFRLLSTNLRCLDEIEKDLLQLVNTSNDKKIKSLAQINLSVYYIENLEWGKALSTLKNVDNKVINQFNYDTNMSYENNFVLAKYFNRKKGAKNALEQLYVLIDSKMSDSEKNIVYNNYISLKILNGINYDEIVNEIIDKYNSFNSYSRFYAISNLLYIYFVKNDIISFKCKLNEMLNDDFPPLLHKYKPFFEYKYKYLLENWENKKINKIPTNISYAKIPKMYYQLVMFGGIERWFE